MTKQDRKYYQCVCPLCEDRKAGALFMLAKKSDGSYIVCHCGRDLERVEFIPAIMHSSGVAYYKKEYPGIQLETEFCGDLDDPPPSNFHYMG